MTTRDDGLDGLTKKQLLTLARGRDLAVNPKRSKGAIVTALREAGATAQDLPAEPSAGDAAPAEGIFIERIALEDGGFAIGQIERIGDVRIAEIDSIIKKARDVFRQRAGLEE